MSKTSRLLVVELLQIHSIVYIRRDLQRSPSPTPVQNEDLAVQSSASLRTETPYPLQALVLASDHITEHSSLYQLKFLMFQADAPYPSCSSGRTDLLSIYIAAANRHTAVTQEGLCNSLMYLLSVLSFESMKGQKQGNCLSNDILEEILQPMLRQSQLTHLRGKRLLESSDFLLPIHLWITTQVTVHSHAAPALMPPSLRYSAEHPSPCSCQTLA